jgi:hypothetical protein
MNQVHNLQNLTMREAYDYTQYCDDIKDGDILIVDDGVGVMVEAWPIMAVGQSTVFHTAAPDFHELTNYKYKDAFATATDNTVQQLVEVAKPCDTTNYWLDLDY